MARDQKYSPIKVSYCTLIHFVCCNLDDSSEQSFVIVEQTQEKISARLELCAVQSLFFFNYRTFIVV